MCFQNGTYSYVGDLQYTEPHMTNFKCDKYGYTGMKTFLNMMRKTYNSQVEGCYYRKSKHLPEVRIQMGAWP